MRDLRELGLNDAGAPVKTPAPTQAQLAIVERMVGATLPVAYVEFLQFSNGGHPKLNTFPVNVGDRSYSALWSVNNFFSISSDDMTTEDTDEVIWRYQQRPRKLPSTLLPVADNSVGDEVFLDLSDTGAGRVVLLALARPPWARRTLPSADVLLPVADSFAEFIDLLAADPDVEEI